MENTNQLTLLSLLLKGGIVMIPIFILSLWSVYTIVERLLFIKRQSKMDLMLTTQVLQKLEVGDVRFAKQLCERESSAYSRILLGGLGMIGKPIKDIEGTMEGYANIEVAEMERNLSSLGLIAGIAPMLGFIGTISGVIRIFYNISLTDNISIGIIAGGLYEKMISSGSGLIVGLLAYTGYHLLNQHIDKFVLSVQKQTLHFLQSIQR